MPTEDIKQRLAHVAKMHQEPKDRLWAAIFALVVLVLIVGAVTVVYAETTRAFMEDGRLLGYERGAIECAQVVIDNDRDFSLPPYCGKPEVAVHYPPEICEKFYSLVTGCGAKWTDQQ